MIDWNNLCWRRGAPGAPLPSCGGRNNVGFLCFYFVPIELILSDPLLPRDNHRAKVVIILNKPTLKSIYFQVLTFSNATFGRFKVT